MLRRLLESRMGRRGKREFVQVLRLVENFRTQEVYEAVRDALRLGAISFDAVKHLVPCRTPGRRTASESSNVWLGALTRTRFAPRSKCASAPDRRVAKWVQSITRSTPSSTQSGGDSLESRYLIGRPPITISVG